ncbi:MAG: hypothetical protein ACTSQP_24680 [Promethearchaeota archaeon]
MPNEIIKRLGDILKDNISERCRERGIHVSLGKIFSSSSIIIKADNCSSIKEEQRKNSGYKKCDCIVLAAFDDLLYLIIIELKTRIKTEGGFKQRFLNCFQKTHQFLKNTFPNLNLKFKLYFFFVYRRNQSITTKFIKSPNHRLTIEGKKFDIKMIPTGTDLSEYFKNNSLLN